MDAQGDHGDLQGDGEVDRTQDEAAEAGDVDEPLKAQTDPVEDLIDGAQLGIHVHVGLEDLDQGLHVGGGHDGLARGGILVGEGLDAVLLQDVQGDGGGMLGMGFQSAVLDLRVIEVGQGHIVAPHSGHQLGADGQPALGGRDLVGQLVQLSGGEAVCLGEHILGDDVALGDGGVLTAASRAAGGEDTAQHGQQQKPHDHAGQKLFGDSCVSFHSDVSFVLIGYPGKGSRGAAPQGLGRCVRWVDVSCRMGGSGVILGGCVILGLAQSVLGDGGFTLGAVLVVFAPAQRHGLEALLGYGIESRGG